MIRRAPSSKACQAGRWYGRSLMVGRCKLGKGCVQYHGQGTTIAGEVSGSQLGHGALKQHLCGCQLACGHIFTVKGMTLHAFNELSRLD
jgi:hypothetical protein